MTPEMMLKLKRGIIAHEEDRARAYLDIYGNITAGMGHNLSARDIAADIRTRWFTEDSTEFYNNWVTHFPWYLHLNEDRQIVLVDFAFMGWEKVLGFTRMLDALSRHDYEIAASEMLNSEWANQVGKRATDLASGMETGVYNP